MKTHINKVISLTALVIISLAFVACGKKSDDSAPAQTTNYQLINGYCYSGQTQVAMTYCSSSGYYMNNNGQCYSQQGQPVAIQYCNNVNNGNTCNTANVVNNGQMQSQVCYGEYIAPNGERGQCNGNNCRGWTMTQVSTCQKVICM